jgi:hypothetical protein
MIISLVPPDGVPPLLLGMSVDEAMAAMRAWGTPEHVGVRGEIQLRVKDDALTRDIFAFFEDGKSVTAIEIWRPTGAEVCVLWEGIDIFGSAADQILAEVERRGTTIDLSERSHPVLPDVAIGFTWERRGNRFESVLVAKPGYYAEFTNQ